jgi:hypothetical protein
MKKWRSPANLAGRRLCAVAPITKRNIRLNRGLQSHCTTGRGEEMALEAFEKAPFPANFQLFSRGFVRVFRDPISEARESARIESQKR